MDKTPKIRQKKSILFLAWLAPIIAIIISYTMLDDYYASKGNIIKIYCKDVKGLNVRKSHIEYKGVQIGDLINIKPDKFDINQFIIEAQIYKEYNYLIKEGSQFLIVESSVGIDKIENISTILTGNYIELLLPTNDTYDLSNLKPQKEFIAIENKPLPNGLIVNLQSNYGSISINTKIEYNGFSIGKVIAKELVKNKINYQIHIDTKYEYLVGKNSYFYYQKPLEIKIDKNQFLFELSPIKNMLIGSIELIQDKTINKDNGYLYESKNKFLFQKEDGFTLRLQGSNIQEDEKILFEGIEVGYVQNVYLKNGIQFANIFILNQYKNYFSNGTKFYKKENIKTNLSLDKGFELSIASMKELIFGGISFEKTTGQITKNKVFILYDSYEAIEKERFASESFEVTIHLDNLYNIKKSSQLFYNNFPIANVKEIEYKKDNFELILSVSNQYKKLFTNNSKIYLEGMQISLSNVKNISSEILGDKLVLVSNQGDSFKNNFTLDSINPIASKYKEGKRLILKAENAKDVSINTPIFYKYFQIGNVEKIELNTKTNQIDLLVFIEKKYEHYIDEKTLFYINRTIDVEFGLFDSKVEIGNLKTLLNGGISIDTLSNFDKQIINKTKDGFYRLILE